MRNNLRISWPRVWDAVITRSNGTLWPMRCPCFSIKTKRSRRLSAKGSKWSRLQLRSIASWRITLSMIYGPSLLRRWIKPVHAQTEQAPRNLRVHYLKSFTIHSRSSGLERFDSSFNPQPLPSPTDRSALHRRMRSFCSNPSYSQCCPLRAVHHRSRAKVST